MPLRVCDTDWGPQIQNMYLPALGVLPGEPQFSLSFARPGEGFPSTPPRLTCPTQVSLVGHNLTGEFAFQVHSQSTQVPSFLSLYVALHCALCVGSVGSLCSWLWMGAAVLQPRFQGQGSTRSFIKPECPHNICQRGVVGMYSLLARVCWDPGIVFTTGFKHAFSLQKVCVVRQHGCACRIACIKHAFVFHVHASV